MGSRHTEELKRGALAQVSFYRANLRFLVVRRPKGNTEEGKPCAEEAIVQYIKCGL